MKKSMLTLTALSALISTNTYSSAPSSMQPMSITQPNIKIPMGKPMQQSPSIAVGEPMPDGNMGHYNMNQGNHWGRGQNSSMQPGQPWMHHDEDQDNGMRHMFYRDGMQLVTDSQGNIIGGYKAFDRNKDGHNIGSVRKGNITAAPVMVIESNENSGTASTNTTDPNASSTIIGYIQHPDYNSNNAGKLGSPSKTITLLQYNKPYSDVKIQNTNGKPHCTSYIYDSNGTIIRCS